ncbi:hypothetical protein [Peribacillus butanolivorans]|uniref:hypothetical protein n=1 Tax=Peribacillus butanolivorans TaxID=421767 RepID=UPI00366BFB2E
MRQFGKRYKDVIHRNVYSKFKAVLFQGLKGFSTQLTKELMEVKNDDTNGL